MSTKAIESVLRRYREEIGPDALPGQEEALTGAWAELEAIREACVTLDAEDIGGLVYGVRDSELQGWEGPRVKAWGEAAQAIINIAKESK